MFDVVTSEDAKGQDLVIVLKGHLDYEYRSTYDLYLIARDNGPNGGKSNSIRMQVNVLDENDNSPVCGKSFFIENVRENMIIKNFMRIQITDSDSVSNSQQIFSIFNSDANVDYNQFEINTKTGWLSLKKGSIHTD